MKRFFICACILALLFAGVSLGRTGTITETGMSQKDLVRYLVGLLNANLTKGGLTSSGAVATAKTTATINYRIGGKLYSMAASTNLTFAPTAAQTVPSYCLYLFSLNSSGKLTVTKGPESSASAGAALPAGPANQAPIGSVLVYASSTAFTMGTSTMGTAVISAPTWYDLSTAISGSGNGIVVP